MNMEISLLLTLLSGLCWTMVYAEGIWRGLRDKSYAIPFWALILNLAWEFLYGYEGYQGYGWKPQTYINTIWFLLDIGIFYTYLRFGKSGFPRIGLPKYAFSTWTILGLVTAMILQWTMFQQFGFGPGAKYSAFLQNLLMSVLFIHMLLQRGTSRGQSLSIAMNKWIGTLAPTINLGLIEHGPSLFILLVGGLICCFDLLYIGLLIFVRKSEPREI